MLHVPYIQGSLSAEGGRDTAKGKIKIQNNDSGMVTSEMQYGATGVDNLDSQHPG